MRRIELLILAASTVWVTSGVPAATRYVGLNNATPASPYTSWATAATNIQNAVDAAVDGDEILVTNGLYATGGRAVYGSMTNRVAIDKAVTVRSVNGMLLTTIAGSAVSGGPNGNGAIRCVYVGSNAVLSGFTLTNGHTRLAGDLYREQSGGGAWCELSGVVSNCTLSGNSAGTNGGAVYSGALNNCTLNGNAILETYGNGGGAYGSVLNNCTLDGNLVRGTYGYGGGACNATLNNCTLSNNSAPDIFGSGGGAYDSTLNNCTLSGNSASGYRELGAGGGGVYGSTLNNCTLSANSASDEGGGAYYSTLTNCNLIGNSANEGGGAGHCTLNNCTLSNNWAWYWGGGASDGTLNNCILSGNSAGNEGGGAYHAALTNCTLSANSAKYGGGTSQGTLNNCTFSANFAYNDGGGTSQGTLNNCVLSRNSAGGYGGGARMGTLNNCVLSGNSGYYGGGAYQGYLTNCTVTGNSASYLSGVGGVDHCALNNCIVYYNSAPFNLNYSSGIWNNSCTTPLPPGPGNFTNAPLFLDTNGWANLRLKASSPCIDAGNNAYAVGTTDLDGRPRIVGTVDIGAYEFKPDVSGEFIGWLQSYGLATDGSADYADPDADGVNNWQEWVAGTSPTNAASVVRMVSAIPGASSVVVTWSSVTNLTYLLARVTDLAAPLVFSVVRSNIAGLEGTTSFTDTNPPAGGAAFYRVAVQPP